MTKRAHPVFPRTGRLAAALGERLRLARVRRRITLVELAARTGASRITLAKLERGDPSVGFGVLLRVLSVLGLEDDLDGLAGDDALGRRLQDADLGRARRRVLPQVRR